jgi:hypothetical protein
VQLHSRQQPFNVAKPIRAHSFEFVGQNFRGFRGQILSALSA